jgi:hypothetical protein
MSDTLPDDTWVQAFQSTSPKPLFDNLKRRLQASHTHVNALSELFKQRAQIEAHYAESLAKLAKTAEAGGLNGKQGVEWDKSGGEAKLWDIVVTDLVEVSRVLVEGARTSDMGLIYRPHPRIPTYLAC